MKMFRDNGVVDFCVYNDILNVAPPSKEHLIKSHVITFWMVYWISQELEKVYNIKIKFENFKTIIDILTFLTICVLHVWKVTSFSCNCLFIKIVYGFERQTWSHY